MKLTVLLILTSALTACAATQVQQHQAPPHRPARESIEAAYKKFEVAFHEGDADAIAQVYAADAEWFIANAPVVVKGREAIGRAWKQRDRRRRKQSEDRCGGGGGIRRLGL